MSAPAATLAPADIPSVAIRAVPAVDAATMTRIDRAAVADYGVTLLQMMEQAGSHLAEVARWVVGGDLRDRPVAVAIGPGHNGGGGLVAARHLANRGARVRVVLSRPALRLSEASRHQLGTLLAMGAECCVATYDLDDADLADVLAGSHAIVDAILGYRIDAAPRGAEERLIELLLATDRPIVSLDLPSGLDPDRGTVPGSAVRATATLALALPKPGLFAGYGPDHAGTVYLGDLGLPAALYATMGIDPGRPFADGRIVRLEPA